MTRVVSDLEGHIIVAILACLMGENPDLYPSRYRWSHGSKAKTQQHACTVVKWPSHGVGTTMKYMWEQTNVIRSVAASPCSIAVHRDLRCLRKRSFPVLVLVPPHEIAPVGAHHEV